MTVMKSPGTINKMITNRLKNFSSTAVQHVNTNEMNWTTYYITGRTDFRHDVSKKLQHSNLNYMPGYAGGTGDELQDMFWVDDTTSLRNFKEAIGSKLIWKHRLKFYACLEEFIEARNVKPQSGFTPDEIELINLMQGAA
jgi:hypothetical protein